MQMHSILQTTVHVNQPINHPICYNIPHVIQVHFIYLCYTWGDILSVVVAAAILGGGELVLLHREVLNSSVPVNCHNCAEFHQSICDICEQLWCKIFRTV